MARSAKTVQQLADQADLDLDEVLLILWDAGIGANGPTDIVSKRQMSAARRALALPRARDLRSVRYLAELAELDQDVAVAKLNEAGVKIIEGARLAKGSVARARNVLGVSGLSVLTSQPEPAIIDEPVDSSFELPMIGVEEQVRFLEVDEIERIHWTLVEDFAASRDPIFPPGVRDQTLLGSATFRPRTSFGDKLKYPTVPLASAALFHSLALNHAFFNGNKRTALVATLVMLEQNNYMLHVPDENDLFRFVLRTAKRDLVSQTGPDRADREVAAIANWLNDRIRVTRNEEYPLKFHELRKILTSYGCTFTVLSGNRILVTRPFDQRRARFWRSGRLRSHIAYAGEGREVDRNTIHKIRRDLWLDEEHGCDSSIFYGQRPGVPDFIAWYRQTLNRLARL